MKPKKSPLQKAVEKLLAQYSPDEIFMMLTARSSPDNIGYLHDEIKSYAQIVMQYNLIINLLINKTMKPEIKKKWLRALRSGKYKQTKEMLHKKNGGYCCLGVLCDIYAKEKKVKWGEVNPLRPSKIMFLDHSDILPDEVMEWAGLASDNPECGEKSLAQYNDAGMRFGDIAVLIEKHL